MKKDYIIFDFDNTLVDSLGYWHKALDKDMFLLHSLKPNKEMKNLRVGTNDEIANNFINLTGLKITKKDVFDGWHICMSKYYLEKVKLIKGVKAFLSALKKQGKKLILCSATQDRTIKIALEHFGFDMFDSLESEETIGVSKRCPEFFQRLLAKLNTTAENVIFFEDSYTSVKNALKNNVECIALLHKFNRDHKKDLIQKCKLAIKDYKDKRLQKLFFEN